MFPPVRDAKIDSAMVSCLMVTLPVPERLAFVKRSIAAFCCQTLPRKELVVLVNGGIASGRDALLDYVGSLKRSDIRVLTPPGQLTNQFVSIFTSQAA
jgi:hypothetical protein